MYFTFEQQCTFTGTCSRVWISLRIKSQGFDLVSRGSIIPAFQSPRPTCAITASRYPFYIKVPIAVKPSINGDERALPIRHKSLASDLQRHRHVTARGAFLSQHLAIYTINHDKTPNGINHTFNKTSGCPCKGQNISTYPKKSRIYGVKEL